MIFVRMIISIIVLFIFMLLIAGYFWLMAWSCAKIANIIKTDETIAAIMGLIFGPYAVILYFILYSVDYFENNKNKKENNNV